jgi:hypothetical protein
MLVTDFGIPMNVDTLNNIIDSQRCLWGDLQLITKPELEHCVELFADGKSILRCMDNDSMIEDNHKLDFLQARLKGLSPTALIIAQYEMATDEPFQVGFNTSEGFVELLHSDELTKG